MEDDMEMYEYDAYKTVIDVLNKNIFDSGMHNNLSQAEVWEIMAIIKGLEERKALIESKFK